MKALLLIIGLLSFQEQISFCQTNEILTNKTITDLVKAGLDNSIIVSKINSSTCDFDVSANSLVALKKSGIPSEVIKAMVDKSYKTPTPPVTEKSGDPAAPALEKINFVYALQSNGSISPLEKALANQKEKQNNIFATAMGVGGAKIVLQIDGKKSPVRLESAQQLNFLVKTGTDAAPQFILYKLKASGSKREATMMKVTVMGGNRGSEGGILIDISKQTNGSFKLTPAKSLEKGEYFFVNRELSNAGSNSEVYAFGID